MTERFAETLLAGGHTNSLGRAGEVLDAVRHDPSRTEELFACIAHEDAWVRMRAIDTFEKHVREDPSRAAPFVERILDDLTRSDQPSVQWHVAQLFDLVELTDSQRAGAVRWLEERVSTPEVDWIVSAQAMTTLVSMARAGRVDVERLDVLLAIQEKHHSASVRRKAARFRERLRRQG